MNDTMMKLVSEMTDAEFDELMGSVIKDPSTIKSDEMKETLAMEAVFRTGRASDTFTDCEIKLYNEVFTEFVKGNITEDQCHEMLDTLDRAVEGRYVGESADDAKGKLDKEWKENEELGKEISSSKKMLMKMMKSMERMDGRNSADSSIKSDLGKEVQTAHKALKEKIHNYESNKKDLERRYKKIGAAAPTKEDGKSSAAEMAANALKSTESNAMGDVSSVRD